MIKNSIANEFGSIEDMMVHFFLSQMIDESSIINYCINESKMDSCE